MDTLNIPASVLLAVILDAVIMIDENGLIFDCNPAAEAMFGHKRADMLGKSSIETLVPAAYRGDYLHDLSQYFSTTTDPNLNTRIEAVALRANGTEFPVELSIAQIHAKNRTILMTSLRDISKDKLAEVTIQANLQNLEHNRKRVEAILNNSADAILLISENFTIQQANPAFTRLFGYDADEMFNRTIDKLVHPDEIEMLTAKFAALMHDQQPQYTELTALRRDGTTFQADLSISPIKSSLGSDFGVVCNIRDITELKRAQMVLAEERNLLRTLIDTVPDYIYIKDMDHKFLLSNIAHAHARGCSVPEDIIGKSDADFFPPDMAAQFRAEETKLFETGTPLIDHEQPSKGFNSGFEWALSTKMPLKNLNGELIGLVGITRDITERKKYERQLRYQANLQENVSDAVIVTDMEFNIQSWNKAAQRIYGWSAGEVVGKAAAEILHTKFSSIGDRDRSIQLLHQRGWWKDEVIQYHQDGHELYILSSVTLVKDDNDIPFGVVSLNLDITGLKQAQLALLKSEERYRLLAENITDVISKSDASGIRTFVTPSCYSLLGYTPEELVGQLGADIIHPDDRPKSLAAIQNALKASNSSFTVSHRIRHKSGHYIWVETSNNIIAKPDTGTLVEMVSVIRDISERKLIENRERKLATNLRAVVDATDELLTIQDINSLYKRAVELAREKLQIERCAIFMLDKSGQVLNGTFGTNDNGETTDERSVNIPVSKNPELITRYKDPWWVTQDGALSTWKDDQIQDLGTGWIATTIIRSGQDAIGIFSNDSAISGSPLDPIQQESLAIYCSLLGNLLRRKRIEENFQLETSRLANLIENLDAGVLLEDEHRRAVLINRRFCDLVSISAPPGMLIGMDCSGNGKTNKHLFEDPEGFVNRIGELVKNRIKVIGEPLSLTDGRFFERDFIPIKVEDRYLGHLWQYRDTTEIVKSRQRQQDLMALEQFQRQIADLFLKADDIKQVMDKILKLVGQTLDLSRVYVAHFRKNERLIDTTLEWCAPGVPSELENNQGVPYNDLFPSLYPILMNNGIIAPRHINELPEDMRTLLELRGFRAVLILPIYTAGRLEGLIGLADYRRDREWLPENITAIRTIADSYARFLERKQAESSLIVARDAALRTARIKSEFMSNMSHEIRTPMTGILGMLELLLETDLNELAHQFADDAYQSAKKLLKIINDILDFSKIEAGQMVLGIEPVDLRGVIHEVNMLLASIAASNDVQIIPEIANNAPARVLGDATRLSQILTNLVGNAVKFTRHGSVYIRLLVLSSAESFVRLRFEVQDTGIGIPESQFSRIFESFVQADGTSTRKFGGTGLGLAISKQLVDLMGGEIEVQSEVGKGSTFSFVLSLQTVDYPADVQFNLSKLSQLRIMLYDEDNTARFMLAQQLRIWGIEVVEVDHHDKLENAVMEAIQRDFQFDTVLIRSTLPLSEGIALYLRTSVPERIVNHLVRIEEPNQTLHRESDSFDAYLERPIRQSDLYNLLLKVVRIANPEQDEQQPDTTKKAAGYVLLAEDNKLNQDIALRALKAVGYKVDIALNGQQTLEMLEQFPYDIILMDIHMPIMDGKTTAKLIRDSHKPYSRTPIIALTASALAEEQNEYLALGMNEVIAKPYSLTKLRSVVMKWVNRSHTG